ncbi:hypothetical protein [Serratia aquatilis]|uniref:Uncharacterized protein n=1 Tax=Serratia aquatilis TaxID=1737515 RepID=A0ABV6EEX3_9GAMM
MKKEEKKHSFFPDVYLDRFSSTIKLTVTAMYRCEPRSHRGEEKHS